MSTLFLDIDGVLNCLEYCKKVKAERGDIWKRCNGDLRKYDPSIDIDPVLVERLNRIVEATNCDIVISSTWRTAYGDRMPAILASRGFKYPEKVVGQTEVFGTIRGLEIKDYVLNHNIDKFCILDDDADMGELLPYLVQTCFYAPQQECGITEDTVQRAIKMLS